MRQARSCPARRVAVVCHAYPMLPRRRRSQATAYSRASVVSVGCAPHRGRRRTVLRGGRARRAARRPCPAASVRAIASLPAGIATQSSAACPRRVRRISRHWNGRRQANAAPRGSAGQEGAAGARSIAAAPCVCWRRPSQPTPLARTRQ